MITLEQLFLYLLQNTMLIIVKQCMDIPKSYIIIINPLVKLDNLAQNKPFLLYLLILNVNKVANKHHHHKSSTIGWEQDEEHKTLCKHVLMKGKLR